MTQHTPGPWGYCCDAAAPDLLAALQEILDESDRGWYKESPVARKARAAIAKAEGRS
jgi:hypothetical protein